VDGRTVSLVRDRGAHGFVQRAIDMATGEEVAVKFIERGRKWKPKHLLRCARQACGWISCSLSTWQDTLAKLPLMFPPETTPISACGFPLFVAYCCSETRATAGNTSWDKSWTNPLCVRSQHLSLLQV